MMLFADRTFLPAVMEDDGTTCCGAKIIKLQERF
jgi:hypothetical protein